MNSESQLQVHSKSQKKLQSQVVIEGGEPETLGSKEMKKDETNEDDVPTKYIVKRKVKKQHCVLYWGCLISILLLSALNVPVFTLYSPTILTVILIFSVVFSLAFFTVNSCKLADTKGDMCKLYFLLDSITIASCTAIIGMVGLLTIILPPQPQVIPIAVFLNVAYFMFGGNSRIIFAYCKYKRWQAVVFKLTVLIGLLVYVVLAAYFMKNSFNALPITADKQDTLKEFFFLYIFGLFTLYMEIFAKANDVDGSSQLQYHHQINYEGNEEELVLAEEEQRNSNVNETEIKGQSQPNITKIIPE